MASHHNRPAGDRMARNKAFPARLFFLSSRLQTNAENTHLEVFTLSFLRKYLLLINNILILHAINTPPAKQKYKIYLKPAFHIIGYGYSKKINLQKKTLFL